MPTKYKEMYNTFCKMFPTFASNVVNYRQHKNGAGIVMTLTDKTEVIFSYVDQRTWWLRTA